MIVEKTQVLQIMLDNQLAAIVHHDMQSRNQIFYKVEKMDADQIKDLLTAETKIGKHD